MVDHLHMQYLATDVVIFFLKAVDAFSWYFLTSKLFLPLCCRFFSDILHFLACNAQTFLLHCDLKQL